MVSAPPRAFRSIASTPFRSMTTPPTSRVNRTRLPLAETSNFSAMLAPLNSIRSAPSWPSTVSLPSPGFQTNVSSPAPAGPVSLPRPPVIRSFPSPPSSRSAPSPPVIVSLPAPPSTRDLDQGGQPVAGGERVVPAVRLTTRFSVVPMSRENGAGADAVEPDAGAVGGDGERLGPVAAVHLDGVGAGPALVQVGAVAGVPDHPVVARLAERLVVAGPAGQHVVAGPAEQQVDPALAEQGVVARPGRRAGRCPTRR